MMRPHPRAFMPGMRGADGVKRRRQVDGDDLVPFLDRKILDRRDELDACVVHQNIDRAEGFLGEPDHGCRSHRGFAMSAGE